MRSLVILFLLCLGLAFVACGSDDDDPVASSNSDLDCTDLTGEAYLVTSSTCNGTEALTDDDIILFSFSSATSAIQSQGEAACQSLISYALETSASSLTMTASGTLSCLANGSSTSSCTHTSNNCDNTTDVDGIDNSWSSCSVDGDTVTLTRTTSAGQAGTVSGCSQGDEEIATLVAQ